MDALGVLYPLVEDLAVLQKDRAVPFKDLFLMRKRQSCQHIIQHTAADRIVVSALVDLVNHIHITSRDPAHTQSGQRKDFRHAAN